MSFSKLAILLLALIPFTAVAANLPCIEVPQARIAPEIKAKLRDPAWDEAAVIPILRPPAGLRKEAPRTCVFLLWSPEYLFVRFHCEDSTPLTPFRGRDKPHHQGDVVEVFLDPAGHSRLWYEIQVTAKNDVLDKISMLKAPPESGPDGTLTPRALASLAASERFTIEGLRTAARKVRGGWIVEIAIPARAIIRSRSARLQPGEIRANFLRCEWKHNASGTRELLPLNWSPVHEGCPHISPQRMGILRLLPRHPIKRGFQKDRNF